MTNATRFMLAGTTLALITIPFMTPATANYEDCQTIVNTIISLLSQSPPPLPSTLIGPLNDAANTCEHAVPVAVAVGNAAIDVKILPPGAVDWPPGCGFDALSGKGPVAISIDSGDKHFTMTDPFAVNTMAQTETTEGQFRSFFGGGSLFEFQANAIQDIATPGWMSIGHSHPIPADTVSLAANCGFLYESGSGAVGLDLGPGLLKVTMWGSVRLG